MIILIAIGTGFVIGGFLGHMRGEERGFNAGFQAGKAYKEVKDSAA